MNKQALIQLLRRGGCLDYIIEAFEKIEREDFVPKSFKKQAYFNTALPSEEGQTISQPSCIAIMLELLELDKIKDKKEVKILEIGSGTGYVLALLNYILPNAKIFGLEINKKLAEKSSTFLKDNKNIRIINKSGSKGCKEHAPFDRILISASAKSEHIIEKLLLQIKDNGIIVSPVNYSIIKLKKQDNNTIKEEFSGFVFVPLVE